MPEQTARGPDRKIAWGLAALGIGMFGFGFALVPLYTLICSAIGITSVGASGGRVAAADAARMGIQTDRMVTVEFDATRNENFTGDFAPIRKSVRLHPGEVVTVAYRVRNATGRKVVTQSIPGITPVQAVDFLKKIECFCFNEQALNPREERDMAINFLIDPDLPKEIKTITLSYTIMTVQ